MGTKFFDSTVIGSTGKSLDFICNVLEYSIEYPVIGKEFDTAPLGGIQNGGRNG